MNVVDSSFIGIDSRRLILGTEYGWKNDFPSRFNVLLGK